MNAFICICTEEYLNYYRELYKSLKTHAANHKQILYYIGARSIDEVSKEFDEVIDANNWFQNCNPAYNTLERICSLRAKVVLNSFERGYQGVIFLGAKVKFFKQPRELVMPLYDGYNAVVTPHILEPLPEDGKFPSNASLSFTGHISTDVVSFKNSPEMIKFLEWQDKIMKTQCRTTTHTYLDQSWLNFLPFFVNDVKILKDPGYNIAYWNVGQRNLDDVVCFQYSGLDLNNPERISNHQNRYNADGDFLEFLKDYAEKVK